MLAIRVKSCGYCPFLVEDQDWPAYCGQSPDTHADEGNLMQQETPPPWCPLRKHSLVVELAIEEAHEK